MPILHDSGRLCQARPDRTGSSADATPCGDNEKGPVACRPGRRKAAAAVWLLLAMGAAALAAGAGCGGYYSGRGMPLLPPIRPASGESARLLSNAHYYQLMGRPQLALRELEEAYSVDPRNPKVADALARGYEEAGDFAQAQKIYQETLAAIGAHRGLTNNLCFSYYLQGKYDQAETCLKEALARDPLNSAARNNLGLLWCRQGRKEEARRLWQETEGTAGAERRLSQAAEALGGKPAAAYTQAPQPSAQRATAVASQPVKTPESTTGRVSSDARPLPAMEAQPAIAAQPKPKRPERKEPSARHASAATTSHIPGEGKSLAVAAPVVPPAPGAGRPQSMAGKKKALAAKARHVAAAIAAHAVKADEREEGRSGAVTYNRPVSSTELGGAAIEVRNGTSTRNLARLTREQLRREGFHVARIGNHQHFGARKTKIYYRPAAERVARAIMDKFFPGAELTPGAKLNRRMDVKVILGHDLLDQPQMVAHLAQGSR